MATPASSDELIQVVRKSGLIDETRLETFLQMHRQAGTLPPDPRKAAGLMVRDGLVTFFQAEQYLLGKWRGFTVGKYKLLERVGFGSMGPVFLCEHLYMKRRVAIKILPPAKAEEPAALGRFYREARASGSMNHPNIVRTHDIDQDGNLHFMVMEYVDGSSMLEILKKTGPMDFTRVAHYFKQAAEALQHAYSNHIVHRDIKPGNLMITRDGQAKLLDMGLARFYKDTNDLLTQKYDENNVLGTADYVAPEQTINSHDVDQRADIYSLGATMYFALAGHPLFPEGIASQKLLWHRTRQPRPIREIRPEVPEGMASILDKMLAKDLDERYQEPREIVEALIPFTHHSIAPPPVIEMPQLSPAAMAPPESLPSEAITPTPGKRPPGAGVPRPQPSTPPPRSPFGTPQRSSGSDAGFEPIKIDDSPIGLPPQRTESTPPAPARPSFASGGLVRGASEATINLREAPRQSSMPRPGSESWMTPEPQPEAPPEPQPEPQPSPDPETRRFATRSQPTPPLNQRPSFVTGTTTEARHPFKTSERFTNSFSGQLPAEPARSNRSLILVILAAILGSLVGVGAWKMFFG